jgi:hypothetical protein
MKYLFVWLGLSVLFTQCKKSKNNTNNAQLVIKFKFDSTQVRLNNIGQPAGIPLGRGAQSPIINKMSAHYVELSPTATTALGSGKVIYRAPETTIGGANAIDWVQSKSAGNGEVFLSIPLKDITPGQYEWMRISLAYQNGDLKYRVDSTINGVNLNGNYTGTLGGFIGFNTYIQNHLIKTQSVAVNANRLQGYWGFESMLSVAGFNFPILQSGQAPSAGTTVVNPLFSTSPIPQGSCVVTAAFVPGKLVITGNETNNITIEASFSTNKSVEWLDGNSNNLWEPLKGEQLIDMGIRGLIPRIQ